MPQIRFLIPLAILLPLALAFFSGRHGNANNNNAIATTTNTPLRPQHVTDALEHNTTLYYFGIGSNMLQSKLVNRSRDGPIEFITMQPGMVRNHRLAFNMRGFPPLEPGMGSIEPSDAPNSKPLYKYHSDECHGALIHMTAQMYDRVMKSEGVSNNSSGITGYEEILVQVYPYDGNSTTGYAEPVTAVALRARPKSRMAYDPSPSLRYMTILRQGAAELGIRSCYRDYLDRHPTEKLPFYLRKIVRNSLVFNSVVPIKVWRTVLQKCLFAVYVPVRDEFSWRRQLSQVAMATLLLPGATIGTAIDIYVTKMRKKSYPPMLQMFLDNMDKHNIDLQNETANEETIEKITQAKPTMTPSLKIPVKSGIENNGNSTQCTEPVQ